MGDLLRAASTRDGCERFEGTLRVEDFPEELTPLVKDDAAEINALKASSDPDGDAMRAARAKCRSLVEYIHEKTGYAFVCVLPPIFVSTNNPG